MKDKFKEFYHPTKKEKDKLKNEGIFVLDASFLLHLYSLPSALRKETFAVLDVLSKKNRLWCPYQFMHEYHLGRERVIKEQYGYYAKVKALIDQSFSKFFESYVGYPFKQHNLLSRDNDFKILKSAAEKARKDMVDRIDSLEKKHPDWRKTDSILNKLTKLLSGRVGDPYPNDEFLKKCESGKERYKRRQPPGFDDSKKNVSLEDGFDQFGDLIGWFQILDYAKNIKKPIIIVTDDEKSDWWWWIDKNTKNGPRKELVKEMYDCASVPLHMLNSDELLLYVDKNVEKVVTKTVIKKIEEDNKRDSLFGIDNILYSGITVQGIDMSSLVNPINMEQVNILTSNLPIDSIVSTDNLNVVPSPGDLTNPLIETTLPKEKKKKKI